MVLAVVVNERYESAYDKSGYVLPFGVFDNEEKAKEIYDIEKQKESSPYEDEDILICKEVELNKPIKNTWENWKENIFLSYWFCE